MAQELTLLYEERVQAFSYLVPSAARIEENSNPGPLTT